MGYFNYYFIKQILKNKKIKKFLILFIIFIFIILIKNNVFASYDFTYNNTSYSLPDPPTSNFEYMTVLIGDTSLKNLYIYYTNVQPYISSYTTSGNTYYAITTGPGSVTYDSYYYYLPNGSNGSWNTYYINRTTTDFRLTSLMGNAFTSPEQIQTSGRVIEVNYNLRYGNTIIVSPPESYNQLPYILNDTQSISLGGQNLIVMPGDFPNSKEIILQLQENNPEDIGTGIIQDNWTTSFSLSLDNQSQFYNSVDSSGVGFDYSIDWAYLSQYLSISKQYKFNLIYTISGTTYTETTVFTYGGSSPEDAIYNQGLQQQDTLNNINENMSDLNNSINNLESTITDDTITSTASDLPSVDVNDPSQNGIDNIFQSIYNAFCTGTAQNIVFPIPFTNKNITLNPYYIRDMLNNNGATWIYTIIQAFWGYLIGRFVVKDISKKITKIKSGNIENIQNENIKEEML